MQLSKFGEKFAAQSGISGLMDDLGSALTEDPSLLFMGGGNPGRIEAVQAAFAQRLSAMASNRDQRHQLLGVYQAPQGDMGFRDELARWLNREYGWGLGPENIAVANGSQSAFFVLYNLFAGVAPDGLERQIHLPLSPEYVGYRDIGLSDNFFSATKPMIERLPHGQFKYHVDFDALAISDSTAALCVSRPSNPTGNVISDAEVAMLDQLARARGIPLIIDGAYGHPFPALIEDSATAFWNDNTILMLSLSKLGLPGVRSGIVIARPDIAQAFSRANTVVSLACGTLGPQLLRGMLDDRSLHRLCGQEIQPFYSERRKLAVRAVEAARGDLPLWIHQPQGAFFLWLWCENLPIDSFELYERLKARGVIVLPGNDFFIGTDSGNPSGASEGASTATAIPWAHSKECLRISYAGDVQTIEAGIALIMSELHNTYANGA